MPSRRRSETQRLTIDLFRTSRSVQAEETSEGSELAAKEVIPAQYVRTISFDFNIEKLSSESEQLSREEWPNLPTVKAGTLPEEESNHPRSKTSVFVPPRGSKPWGNFTVPAPVQNAVGKPLNRFSPDMRYCYPPMIFSETDIRTVTPKVVVPMREPSSNQQKNGSWGHQEGLIKGR